MYIMNGICYAGEYVDNIKISAAKHVDRGILLLLFSTGEYRLFDSSSLTGEVFGPLVDDNVFGAFSIDHGVVTWLNGEIDCAPEFMYNHSMKYENA